MTDPRHMGRALDAMMGAMSPADAPPADDGPDYAAQACEALRIASGVDPADAIAALDAAIVAIAFYVPGEHDTSRTLRAMRAGLEGEKG